jgi:hypothetical protein
VIATPPDATAPSLPTRLSRADWGFVVGMWLASRALVAVAMGLVAPRLPVPPGAASVRPGWDVFVGWDGGWYERIAHLGYEYAPDGAQHAIAFFPVYPGLVRAVAALGPSIAAAGAIVSHVAFFVALATLYAWLRDREGVRVARWAVALLAWCPYSLFASVVYTEGLFLALSLGAMRAFDKGRYGWAALWGALASGTRVVGIGLAPAMAWAFWRDRRPRAALVTALATSAGLLAFMAYQAAAFGDPLAFVHAQAGWHGDPSAGAGLWALVGHRLSGLSVEKLVMAGGGAYALWRARRSLPAVATGFAVVAYAMLIASGTTDSLDRYIYGLAPVAMATGWLLARHPRVGAGVLTVFVAMLVSFALRFARGFWVA